MEIFGIIGQEACFAGDVVVKTKDRWTRICYVEVGDLVLSRCERTGVQSYRRVTKTFEHLVNKLYIIAWELHENETAGVEVTGEHPFWVKNKGWVDAQNIEIGDQLQICDPYGLDDYELKFRELPPPPEDYIGWVTVVTAERYSALPSSVYVPVYNIEVEDFHTYFVGCYGAWVHNTKSSSILDKNSPDKKVFGQLNYSRKLPSSEKEHYGLLGEFYMGDLLAKHGYRVDILPANKESNKVGKTYIPAKGKPITGTPDIFIDHRVADILAPKPDTTIGKVLIDPETGDPQVMGVYGEIYFKTMKQATDICLDLRGNKRVSPEELIQYIKDNPIPGLARLFIGTGDGRLIKIDYPIVKSVNEPTYGYITKVLTS